MSSAETASRRESDRFRILQVIYGLEDAHTGHNRFQVRAGDLFGLVSDSMTPGDVGKALEGLVRQGLLEDPYLEGGTYFLTDMGRFAYEEAVEKPATPTQQFPSVVNITNNIGTMTGSQLQQATHSSTQSMTATINGDAVGAVKAVLQVFEHHLASIALADDARKELEAELSTLRVQVDSPKPKATILAECLKSVRVIVEGVASAALSNAVLPQIGIALAALGLA